MIRRTILATALLAANAVAAEKIEHVAPNEQAEQTALDYDQEQLKIAQSIPGFAGYTLEDNGIAQVFMVQQKGAADLSTLKRAFGDNVVVKPAQFTFEELYQQKLAATALFSRPDLSVISVDLDEVQNRVVIGVDSASTRSQLMSLENEFSIRGLPRDAIVVENVQIEDHNIGKSLRAGLNPVPAGAEISLGGGCTVGVNVVRGGVAGFITAAHCAYNAAGASVEQPTGSGVVVGSVNAYGSATTTGCPSGEKCKSSDALFVKYGVASFSKLGYIAKTAGLNKLLVTDFYRIKDVSSSPSGTVTFMKTGRTSGMTSSTSAITRTCINVKYTGDAFTYLCLNTFKNNADKSFSQGGDSGSAIFIDLGNKEARLVGVLKGLFNGDPLYSPWSGVTKDFGTLTIR